MPYTILRNDIVNMEVEAIVNSTGSHCFEVGGVEGSILNTGGTILRKEHIKLGDIGVSEARYTSAPNLHSKYIIHVRGPIYKDGKEVEQELRNAYRNSLNLAVELNIKSIAFPLVSSGSYGYPKKRALVIAQEEILRFLEYNEMMIYLVVYDKTSFSISLDFQREIDQYIETVNTIEVTNNSDFRNELQRVRISKSYSSRSSRMSSMQAPLHKIDIGFTETLLQLIDKTGQKDSVIYKKANIDRKLFSKIRNNPYYKPSKNTIVAFAIALELSLDGTNSLLSKAGYVLSNSILFDVIVTYCIRKKTYDIYEVNNTLFVYDQELLGSQ